MNISYNWLGSYIDHGMDAFEMAEQLTSCGLEVESVEEYDSVPGGLKGLVIGHVLETWKHPDADKLTVTKVDVGGGQINQIVCGAPNVAKDQFVVVALPGTKIYPVNGESFEIRKAKIRGELSEGMICAEDEIGLGTSHEGIIILTEKVAAGTPANEYFRLESDHILSIGLTPNRADAVSHIGVARDLSALLRTRKDVERKVLWPEINAFAAPEKIPVIDVQVKSKDCVRYSGVHLRNINVSESPDWLKSRLLSVGLHPINNIVDITNFVQYEMGQPLHAFDASKIKGRKVVVRSARKGEKFVTLDEVERELKGSELMICDTDNGMCIAGVFGGLNSGVSSETTEVFLESACFDPVSIRKTSKVHGLKTDASFRFERGTDPDVTIAALKRASLLIAEICGGEVSSSVIDIYTEPVRFHDVKVSLNRINQLNGLNTSPDKFEKILSSLEIKALKESTGIYNLQVPPYRVDVRREADIAEEVIRLTGYDEVPLPERMHMPMPAVAGNSPDKVRRKLLDFLVANGFTEVMNNSLTTSSHSKQVANNISIPAVIRNPLSKDLDILRTHMLFPMLQTAVYNSNRKRPDLRLVENGFVYSFADGKYSESEKTSILFCGNRYPENWMNDNKGYTPYYIKSVLNSTLHSFGFNVTQLTYTPFQHDLMNTCMQVSVDAKVIGYAGKILTGIVREFDLTGDVWYGELDMSALYKKVLKVSGQIAEPPKYPEVRRDLSLILDKNLEFAQLENMAYQTERKLLRSVNLFDIYEGDRIEKGKKSYAMSFHLRDDEKTLTDKDIEKVMNKLMANFESKLGAIVRKS